MMTDAEIYLYRALQMLMRRESAILSLAEERSPIVKRVTRVASVIFVAAVTLGRLDAIEAPLHGEDRYRAWLGLLMYCQN